MCVGGCFYNAFQITSAFLAYDVLAESWFYSKDTLTPPLFTFCVRHTDKYDQNSNNSHSSVEFFKHSSTFLETFVRVAINIPNERLKVLADILAFEKSNVITYAQYYHMCFAVNLTIFNGSALHFSTSYRKSQTQPLIFLVTNLTDCSEDNYCAVYLNDYRSMHVDLLGNGVKIGYYTVVEYVKEELYLQKPPYVTACRDYRAEGFGSQDDCTDSCLKTQYIAAYDEVHAEAIIMSYENISFRKMSDQRILKLCENSCSQVACELHTFLVTAVSGKSLTNTSRIMLSFPLRKLTVYYIPKIQFWDFLTLFGSVFGFWFGVSAFGLIDQFLLCLTQMN